MILAVTPGDPDGVGPEILWKTLQARPKELSGVRLLCVGAREPFDRMGAPVVEADTKRLEPPSAEEPVVWLLRAPSQPFPGARGKKLNLAGFQSGWSIVQATRLVQDKKAAALVTGPISKERLNRGGYRYPGHTEFLAELCRDRGAAPPVTMMLANDRLRVTLVTTHLPLSRVSRSVTRRRIRQCVHHTFESLRDWWAIPKPRIAVCGLNPHAGESGMLGKEEIRVIIPELERLRRDYGDRAELIGPLPSDTLFAKHVAAPPAERYDAVVCMYHDQGLIPVKQLDFPNTVNVTLGLPIIRTSVDHGVGFDIAGLGKADPSSLQSAIRLALRLAGNRNPSS